MAPNIVSSLEKLTIEEIERRYRDEWVLIVDYDFEFPKMKLTAGFVHAHCASRAALQPLAQNLRRCAVHWTGPIHEPRRHWRSRVVHAVDPDAGAIVIEVEIFGPIGSRRAWFVLDTGASR